MKPRTLRSFWTEDRAAISPLYAVGILALVAVSGVGFDYGRLYALDSELQNAADQAALAAATQLDGGADAMTRARDAATNAFAASASAYVNETRFANDARLLDEGVTSTRPITDLTFVFYDDYSNDAVGNVVELNDTDGEQARVVEVTVNARQVFFALTPVVGAISSGNVIGKALAALEEGTCNVPPMFFCVPEDDLGVPDTTYPTAANIGQGLKLHFKDTGNDSPGNPNDTTTDNTAWAPGNFGFLGLDYFPANQQNETAGLNSYILGCTGGAPISDPGFRTPQGSALNSRFDFYPPPKNQCNTKTGDFCPAQNVTKHLVLKMPSGATDCDNPPNNIQPNDWIDASTLDFATPDHPANGYQPGYNEDTNFATDSSTMFGNGNWNAADWLNAHHSATLSDVPDLNDDGNISRYEVYQWELDPLTPTRLDPQFLIDSLGDKYCSFPRPVAEPPGVVASDTQKDRRLLTVAAVDCSSLNGKEAVKVLRWVDLFLVKPVNTSGSDRNFFSEIVSPARKANGDSGFQYFGRKKAVLIR
jgi:Flp pilus assembly protein TadG